MKLTVLYFASISEALDCEREHIELPSPTASVMDLKAFLSARGELWQHHIENPNTRCAINQTLAKDDSALSDHDEIAFFPPVTGG